MAINLKPTKLSPTVISIECKVPKNPSKWEQWFLLRSDVHHDNTKCDHELERRHLEEAKERQAGILDFGDNFCAMQGKYDARSDKSAVRPENQEDDYLDSLVRSNADFLEPYAENLMMLGIGNHEWSIMDRHETHLTERLAQTLRDRTRKPVPTGAYRGWVRLQFKHHNNTSAFNIHYFHGTGGGGMTTKGVNQTARDLAIVEGADAIVRGHIHEAWVLESVRTTLNRAASEVSRTIYHVQCPTYKQEFFDSEGTSWHIRTGKPPKPLGAWWLKFTMKATQGKRILTPTFLRAE